MPSLSLLLPVIFVLVGLGILVWSANHFIDATANIALQLNISPLITGLIIVGFATSAPEIIVGIKAAMENKIDLAIGNAIGSNIANIGLILGLTAIFLSPITIKSTAIKKIYMLMFIAMFVPLASMLHGSDLSQFDGLILLSCLIISFFLLKKIAMNVGSDDPVNSQFSDELDGINKKTKIRTFLILVMSFLALLLGASIFVDGAVDIAQFFGVSNLVIGLTIVAIGTSLPEIAASAASIMKKKADIAIGNIIGSNMFNMLAVLGIPALIQGSSINRLDPYIFMRDFTVMFALTIMLAIMLFGFKGVKLTQTKGVLLLLCFMMYQYLIYKSIIG
ncbi:MAG: calcium/sodium antiporter [Legionellales bacterium]|nr:calcium/sodium antiporter [Legionellales bacterium]